MNLRERLKDLAEIVRNLPDMRPCSECGGRRSARGCEGPARCIRHAADGTTREGTFMQAEADFCATCGRVLDAKGHGIGAPRGEGTVFNIWARGAKRDPAKVTGGA